VVAIHIILFTKGSRKMSVSSGLSGRYAKAIYELAVEKKITTKIVDDFVRLKKLLEESDSLSNLINSPAISKSDKQNSILKILNKAKAQKLTIKFFGTLANNGRLILIKDVIEDFLSVVSRINGEVKAEVTSSFALDQNQQKKVVSAISEATGIKKIILSTSVDESLIGGLIVKIGSKMIDNSLKSKLNRLEIVMRGTN
jgi:F-type H+-transporting ATPase subunit delta